MERSKISYTLDPRCCTTSRSKEKHLPDVDVGFDFDFEVGVVDVVEPGGAFVVFQCMWGDIAFLSRTITPILDGPGGI